MQEKKFDVIFIGGGGASFPGAFELAEAGKSVLIVDNKGNLGGDCLYAGCLPSKAVRTKILEYTTTAKNIDPEKIWTEVVETKERIQETIYNQFSGLIKMHEPNLTFAKGWATILSPNKVKVEGNEENFEAEGKYLVIAAGAENVILNVPGKEFVITSNDLFAYQKTMKKLPKSIAIIGGGYIGVEAADMLSRLGVHISIIEMMERLLPTMPVDISKAAEQRMRDAGVEFHLNSPLASIEKKGELKIVKASGKDKEVTVEAEEVLMAVGRKARTKGYGLETLQKEGLLVERGGIAVSPSLRTTLNNVFATGDVTGKAMLFHAAVKESLIVAKNILTGKDTYRMNYHSIPFTIFTYPEISMIGYTEEELKSLGIQYEVVNYTLAGDPQSMVTNHTEGWMKIFIEKESLRLLGAQIFAHNAADLIGAFTVAMENNLTAKNLAWSCMPHPLTFESINYSMRPYF
ncbi:MAG: dihydrolipoyl dehydrogenase [Caldisphaera sp.]|jgi:dihydrolipoamide dehydrogenase|nr:dihydrolipoyl dehydrogenase [Caldisphaera sp.]PMP91569.1 MAG: dihydrolipoyl dehydrogenase [Caldisphaera sp.]